MEFKDWLAATLAERGLTPSDLARMTRVPQPTIFRILTGETKDPRINTVNKVTRALGAEPPNVSPGPEIRGSVPIINSVQAGNYMEVIDNLQPGEGERIETTVPVKRYTYALRVEGDSMEPVLPAGAILIVEPEMQPQHGDYVIVKNGDGASVKQLIRDGDDWYLKPENPRYPIKPLPENATICGVVRGMERKFR